MGRINWKIVSPGKEYLRFHLNGSNFRLFFLFFSPLPVTLKEDGARKEYYDKKKKKKKEE